MQFDFLAVHSFTNNCHCRTAGQIEAFRTRYRGTSDILYIKVSRIQF